MQKISCRLIDSKAYRLMSEGCRRFGLLEDGDRILVGVSGGKDSLTLLELLGQRQRMRVPSIHVEAVHVRMREVEYESDADYLRGFAERCGVRLHVRETGFTTGGSGSEYSEHSESSENSENSHTRKPKPACWLCSWARRKVLFGLAQELGCNKIALGHHQDDIIRTALMNLTFQGQFSTMPALLAMRKMPLAIIRPLCCVPEAETRAWAESRDYRPQAKHCPHERETNRTAIEGVLRQMETLNPDARRSIWNALVAAGKLVERNTD